MLIETAHGHVFDHACPQWADGTLGGIGGHQGFLSRAEGCWTFDARDRTPRPSRATAHHFVENALTETRAPLPRERVRWGPDRRLAVKVSTRNITSLVNAAVVLIDQLKEIYIDGELEQVDNAQWFAKIMRHDYAVALG